VGQALNLETHEPNSLSAIDKPFMQLTFSKYQGTGNDFILIDNMDKSINLTREQIAFMCHRRFGIGADGLMLLEPEEGYDFRMVYYNADGNESTMCGNGGRCITAFARMKGVIDKQATFLAVDGPHKSWIHEDDSVSLEMMTVTEIQRHADHLVINTGSPHYVTWVNDTEAVDVFGKGRDIRNRAEYGKDGINVNFVQKLENGIRVRTYERGVEDETMSCGTGVTAAAIAWSDKQRGRFTVPTTTPGGILEVSFNKDTESTATDVILKGPATFVYEGNIALPGAINI